MLKSSQLTRQYIYIIQLGRQYTCIIPVDQTMHLHCPNNQDVLKLSVVRVVVLISLAKAPEVLSRHVYPNFCLQHSLHVMSSSILQYI